MIEEVVAISKTVPIFSRDGCFGLIDSPILESDHHE